MKEEVYLWILGRLKIILIKIKDQSVLIVIHINIWQRNAKDQEKKRKTRKYYKYNKVEHIAKDCISE